MQISPNYIFHFHCVPNTPDAMWNIGPVSPVGKPIEIKDFRNAHILNNC